MREIRNLEVLLKNNLQHRRIEGKTVTQLSEAGDNYCSVVLALDLTLNDGNVINAVAKLLPPFGFFHEIGKFMFRQEHSFYTKVVPTLNQFQEQYYTKTLFRNLLPPFYASRLNLLENDGKTVNEDAVVVLENIKHNGFIIYDRLEGFNLEAAEVVVRKLALFHAIPLAMKILQPELFEKDIIRNVEHNFFDNSSDIPSDVDQKQIPKDAFLKPLEKLEELEPYLERLKSNLDFLPPGTRQNYDSKFATITHNDFWGNNIMFNTKNGKIDEVKIIDFQITRHGSAARDLLLFLFTSVKLDDLRTNVDNLLKIYHSELIKILDDIGCDTTGLNYEEFEKELAAEAKHELDHIILMLRLVFLDKKDAVSSQDLDDEFMFKEMKFSDAQNARLLYTCLEFIRRNWV